MTVHVTHGRKYHIDNECPLMNTGEDLWDFDGDAWGHTSGAYRRRVATVTDAAYLGKLPCLHCVPVGHRVFPPLYGQTFGHEPVDEYDGTPEGDKGVTRTVCARCMTWNRWKDVSLWAGSRVTWPCTSAVVLELVPRPDTKEK